MKLFSVILIMGIVWFVYNYNNIETKKRIDVLEEINDIRGNELNRTCRSLVTTDKIIQVVGMLTVGNDRIESTCSCFKNEIVSIQASTLLEVYKSSTFEMALYKSSFKLLELPSIIALDYKIESSINSDVIQNALIDCAIKEGIVK